MNYLRESNGMQDVMRMMLTNNAEVEEICKGVATCCLYPHNLSTVQS